MDAFITIIVFGAVGYFVYWRLKVRKEKRDGETSTGTGGSRGGADQK